jgi:hypothetical protein
MAAQSSQSSAQGSTLWLVEHYRPGADTTELRRRMARLREAVVALDRSGRTVQIVAAAIVPTDEGLVCVVRAPSEDNVREACRRSHIRLDRLTLALPDEP